MYKASFKLFEVGNYYLDETRVPNFITQSDIEKALHYYTKAEGHAGAQYKISIIYSKGYFDNYKNPKKAFEFLLKVAMQSNREALMTISDSYRLGDYNYEIKKDLKKAIPYLEILARMRDVISNYKLSEIYCFIQYAEKTERYDDKIKYHLHEAVMLDFSSATIDLEDTYIREENYIEATKWYKKSMTINERYDKAKLKEIEKINKK